MIIKYSTPTIGILDQKQNHVPFARLCKQGYEWLEITGALTGTLDTALVYNQSSALALAVSLTLSMTIGWLAMTSQDILPGTVQSDLGTTGAQTTSKTAIQEIGDEGKTQTDH